MVLSILQWLILYICINSKGTVHANENIYTQLLCRLLNHPKLVDARLFTTPVYSITTLYPLPAKICQPFADRRRQCPQWTAAPSVDRYVVVTQCTPRLFSGKLVKCPCVATGKQDMKSMILFCGAPQA
jgi:hypothetical protein